MEEALRGHAIFQIRVAPREKIAFVEEISALGVMAHRLDFGAFAANLNFGQLRVWFGFEVFVDLFFEGKPV